MTPLNSIATVCGAVAAALGAATLTGWALEIPGLTLALPGQTALQPTGAACLLLSGLSLTLRAWMCGTGKYLIGKTAQETFSLAGMVLLLTAALSTIVAAMAAWTLQSYIFDQQIIVDFLLFPESVASQQDPAKPGRMAFETALTLLMINIVLIASSRAGGGLPSTSPADGLSSRTPVSAVISWIATLSLALPALSIIGYMLRVDLLHGVGFVTTPSLSAAVGVMALAVGTLALVPETGWVARLSGSGPGSRTARTLLVVAIAGPLGVAWLLDLGVEAGLYHTDFRLALVAVVTASILVLTIFWHSSRLDRADAAERESGRRLSLFIENAPAAIAMFDRDMRYLAASRRYFSDYRLPPGTALIGRSHYEIFPDVPREWRDLHSRALAGATLCSEDDPFPRADGRTDWVRWQLEPWHDAVGEIGGILLFSEVVTQRHEAQQALIESEARLRRVIENAPFPVMVHSEGGQIIHISRTWLDATGYGAEDIKTISDWIRLAYGDRAEAIHSAIDHLYALDRPIEEGDYEVRTADGHTMMWALRSAPAGLDGHGRRMVVSMAADVTERQRTEARLRLLTREVDHRAKNALAVVQAIVQLTQKPDAKDFASSVEGRVAAMGRAHSLLASSGWTGADLRQMVQGELDVFSKSGDFDDVDDGRQIQIAGLPVAVKAEAAQPLCMALHELADNAARHGALSRDEGRLSIGWVVAAQSKILCLDWVEQGGPPLAGPPSRTGFGSMLLHQTIENQLDGRLSLEWKPEGLVCRINLPASIWRSSELPHQDQNPDQGAVRIAKDSPGGKYRVLIVEDEALTAMALERLLRQAGFEILGPASRVQDALDLVRNYRPDAAVLDINLFGEMVGPVADELEGMGVPFVLCTGYQNPGTVSDQHVQAPVLRKPVNRNDLIAAVGGLFAAATR